MTDDQPVETNKVIPTSSILASPNPEHVEGEGGPKTNTVLIAIIFVLALALVGFTAFYFGTKNRVITPPDIVSNVSPTPFSSPNESTNQPTGDLEQYDSPQLTNFGFAYDPEIWSISQLPTPTNTKLIMAAKDGGVLTFVLDLPWGMGGGASTFKTSDLTNLTAKPEFYRLKRISAGKTSYDYGTDQAVRLFSAKPDSKTDALKQCQDMSDGVDGMFFYTPEQCSQITSGEIVGYVNQPGFTRSYTFQPSVALGEINTKWAGDEYVDSLGDTYVIVAVTYSGSNPALADDIISQLKPL
ncbi:hypothetical protein A3B57_00975 [Microgenomates group bacterium RIFCSPLOWO2_01_FULL_47_10]|nr:MAG: hypothetical protein A3B57_00975 [Microgenomates group bacterium RIFCSPLOWO2_01_FULL_47_10]